jgi:hypothetical protein
MMVLALDVWKGGGKCVATAWHRGGQMTYIS